MRLTLDLQIATEFTPIPTKATFKRWIKSTLTHSTYLTDTELTLRLVDRTEIQEINRTYRKKDCATNVLSFPFEKIEGIPLPFIGDMIICLDVVKAEAIAQHKTFYHHLTHMVVHGTLHLLGYDHIEPHDAIIMETLEINLLKQLMIKNPYEA